MEDAVANGENITQLLDGDFRLERSKNIEIIDNPTKYYFMAYQASLVAMLPKTGINQLLSSSFLLPFLYEWYLRSCYRKRRNKIWNEQSASNNLCSQWQNQPVETNR